MNLNLAKFSFVAPLGFFAQYVQLIPLVAVGLVFLMADAFTAWRLAVRLRKKGKSTGKFKSEHSQKIWKRGGYFFMVVILAFILEKYVLLMFDTLYLANWVAGVFCVSQGVSILENISSDRDGKWAELLQKVLIDKSSRHYDIDLSDVVNDKDKKDGQC